MCVPLLLVCVDNTVMIELLIRQHRDTAALISASGVTSPLVLLKLNITPAAFADEVYPSYCVLGSFGILGFNEPQ